MPEDQNPQADAAEGEAPAQAAAAQQQQRTPEEVEAEWQARHTALGRQHAAETKALRDQLAALSAAQQTAEAAVEGTVSEAEALRQQLAAQQRLFQQREQEYTATLRATKYPFAAEALEPQVLATMDEAKLAGLEARLTPSRSGARIDPSTPARNAPTAPKPLEEKTAAELREELARLAPGFAAEMRSNY
jgi:hypothetical protein